MLLFKVYPGLVTDRIPITELTDVNGHANDSMTVIASGHTTNNVNQIGGVYRLNFNVDGNW